MDRLPPIDPTLQKSFLSVALGFVGVTGLILFLPKTIKYLLRRFVTGLVGEIVAVVLTGLLTEKVVSWIGHEPRPATGRAPRVTPAPPASAPRGPF